MPSHDKPRKTIGRSRRGSSFSYIDNDTGRKVSDKRTLDRIRSLRVPPAYQDVVICKNPDAKVLAYGRDLKGRKQTIYNKEFVEAQRAKRFAELAGFDKTFVKIKNDVAKRLMGSNYSIKDKMIALIVRLMIVCHFRIGSQDNVHKYNTFGLTTLLGKHVTLRGQTAEFSYIGKKGVLNESKCQDSLVVSMLKRLKQRGSSNSPLFMYEEAPGVSKTITATQINDYLKSFDPNITSKDIRTYEANRLFISHFRKEARVAKPASDTAWKKVVREAVKKVAFDLHNTPAVARKDYIHKSLTDNAETDSTFRQKLIGGAIIF